MRTVEAVHPQDGETERWARDDTKNTAVVFTSSQLLCLASQWSSQMLPLKKKVHITSLSPWYSCHCAMMCDWLVWCPSLCCDV